MDEKNEADLDLLKNPAFLKYLANLPIHRFRGVLVVDEETGEAKTIISKQEGDNPPDDVQVVSEE